MRRFILRRSGESLLSLLGVTVLVFVLSRSTGDPVRLMLGTEGTPEQIADRLGELRDAGVDGINLAHWTLPDSYVEFVDEVMPVLRLRGLARTEYSRGGLRERLTGSAQVNPRHPAARYRGAFRD